MNNMLENIKQQHAFVASSNKMLLMQYHWELTLAGGTVDSKVIIEI